MTNPTTKEENNAERLEIIDELSEIGAELQFMSFAIHTATISKERCMDEKEAFGMQLIFEGLVERIHTLEDGVRQL